jgi:flagellar biosynthesis/type III secretory pathway protein FliH
LADEVYHEGRPVTIPDDLREMVELGMKPEEAEMIARKREEAKRGPIEQERKKREAESQQRIKDDREKAEKAHEKAVSEGYKEINEVAQPFAKKFGAEWKQIGEEVTEKLCTLLPDVNPSGWRKIAKEVIEATIAKRRAVPLKRPSMTPPPGRGTSRSSDGDDDVPSEEEEVQALASGKF